MTTTRNTIREQLEFRQKELLVQQEDIFNTLNEWTEESSGYWCRVSSLDNLGGVWVDIRPSFDQVEITVKRRNSSGTATTYKFYLKLSRCGTTEELLTWVDSYLLRFGFILMLASDLKIAAQQEVVSEPVSPVKTTLRSRVLEYVRKNPNCSSQDVWKHFKTDSARRTLSDLHALDLIESTQMFEARRTGSGETHRYINRYTVKE